MWFSKRFALFVFRPIISLLSSNKNNGEFTATPLQPSKWDCFSSCFFDSKIHSVYHTRYGVLVNKSKIVDMIANTFLGRLFPTSNYKFVNEQDYITTMSGVGFTGFTQSDLSKPTVEQLLNLFEKYIGYLLFEPTANNTFILNTHKLSKYEIRKGYSNLKTLVCLNADLSFKYCEVGEKRYFADSPGIDFAVRECITAIMTLITIEKHLFNIHMSVNDKMNAILETQLIKIHPVRRLLGMYSNRPYFQQEFATVSLLGPKGLSNVFNLTHKGVIDYMNEYLTNHDIRKEMYVAKHLEHFSNNGINGDMKLWWDCIYNFVNDFLKLHASSLTDYETTQFLNTLKQEYPDICGSETDVQKNLCDICTIVLFSNIIHETYSNSSLGLILCNPFLISSTWKENASNNLADKVNNLSEQLMTNIILTATKPDSVPIGSEMWENMFGNTDDERNVFRNFRNSIQQLDIAETSILHPKNISSSISA
jgi:hypothetical protein